MKYFIVILSLIFASVANAQECQNFKDSGDGIPAEYFRFECEGKKALKAGQYEKAVKAFEKALSIRFYEAPNYELNVDLAEALCKLGNKDKAHNIIREFKCMAAVDLGELRCYGTPGNPNPKLTEKCKVEMCDFGGGLTLEGRNKILTLKARMENIEKACK